MPEGADHQPHDKLFKAGFSDPTTAAAFLQSQLSPPLSSAIAWDQLALQPGSFVDSHFRHSESDLLFSAPLHGSDCLIHLLFEHQVREDRWIALRLLRYMVRIWESRVKTDPGKALPVILPVVLAQNAGEWKLNPAFTALLDIPPALADDLRPFVPQCTFRLIQLSEIPFEAIAGTPAGIMILRTMKAERIGSLLADPVWDEELLSRLPRSIFELLLRYMLNAEIDPTGFQDKVKSIARTELQTTAMTLAQHYRQEGRQEGLQEGHQEGRQEGRQEAILQVLELRFGPLPIGLTAAVREIHADSRLHALQRASIEASSLEEFSQVM